MVGRGWLAGLAALGLGTSAALLAWLGAGGFGGDPGALRDEAIAYYESGDWDRALERLRRLESSRELTADERMLRAQCAMGAGRDEEALSDLESVPDDHPSAALARFDAGRVERRRGRLGAAERCYRRALEIDAGFLPARRELAFVLGLQLRRDDFDANFRAMAELTELTTREVWLWCMSTDLIWWEPNELTPDLERYLANDPSDVWTRIALAENYRRMNRYDDAEALLRELPSENADGRAALARLALERDNLARVAELVSEGPEEHLELARIRGKLALVSNRPEEALRHLRIAHRLGPQFRSTMTDLATALRAAGRAEEAAPYNEAARRVDRVAALLMRVYTFSGEARGDFKELAGVYEEIGDLDKAAAWWRQYLRADPLDAEGQRALYRLREAKAARGGDGRPPRTLAAGSGSVGAAAGAGSGSGAVSPEG